MIYVLEKDLGLIGSRKNSNWIELEIGHYEEDGLVYDSKLFVFWVYRNRNGDAIRMVDGRYTLEEAKALEELLSEIDISEVMVHVRKESLD